LVASANRSANPRHPTIGTAQRAWVASPQTSVKQPPYKSVYWQEIGLFR
jgi:hypothetical protein